MTGGTRVGAVILAAGRSERMGASDKLLEEVAGVPMVVRVLDVALSAGADPVVVVTGPDAHGVRRVLEGRDVTLVENPDRDQGMASSLALGVRTLLGLDTSPLRRAEPGLVFRLSTELAGRQPADIERAESRIRDLYQDILRGALFPVGQHRSLEGTGVPELPKLGK